MNKSMNIGIDARMYGLENAGIGRYIKSLCSQLFKADRSHTYTLFLRSRYSRTLQVPKHVSKVTANFSHYSLDEQTKFVKTLKDHPVDLMHFPHFNVPLLYHRPFVVTIHDLLWHKTKGLSVTSLTPLKYAIKYWGYQAVVNHALARSRHILVPSQFVKQEVIKYGGDARKITVTPEGIDSALVKAQPVSFNSLAKTLKLSGPFVVYTGSAYPHKNVKRLILAVKHYQEETGTPLKLVIISSRNIFLASLRQFVKQQKLGKSVVFSGFLSDRQVKTLYQHAIALVHPSLSEGFGLTGLEAMAVGLPVITSDRGSLPEVYGSAASFIDPMDPVSISQAILELSADSTKRLELINLGYDQASKYSWQATARQTKDIYQAAVGTL